MGAGAHGWVHSRKGSTVAAAGVGSSTVCGSGLTRMKWAPGLPSCAALCRGFAGERLSQLQHMASDTVDYGSATLHDVEEAVQVRRGLLPLSACLLPLPARLCPSLTILVRALMHHLPGMEGCVEVRMRHAHGAAHDENQKFLAGGLAGCRRRWGR